MILNDTMDYFRLNISWNTSILHEAKKASKSR